VPVVDSLNICALYKVFGSAMKKTFSLSLFLILLPGCATYVTKELHLGNFDHINGAYCNKAVNTDVRLTSYLFYEKLGSGSDNDIVSIEFVDESTLKIEIISGAYEGGERLFSGDMVDGRYFTEAKLRFLSKWYGLVNGIGREKLRLSLLEDGNLQIRNYLYVVSGPLVIPIGFSFPSPVENYIPAFKKCRIES